MILSELGTTIRELRKQKGLSQEVLAEQAGISRTTLSKHYPFWDMKSRLKHLIHFKRISCQHIAL